MSDCVGCIINYELVTVSCYYASAVVVTICDVRSFVYLAHL